MMRLPFSPWAAGLLAVTAMATAALAAPGPVPSPAGASSPRSDAARPTLVAGKQEVEREKPSDLAGRYAVLREKRDTGCMVTLDNTSHAKGGDRAQLAPGCRDQGIVVFDPSAWQVVKGELVLTARAGHKTKLERQEDGTWTKDVKDGSKPLGLKKL